MKCKNCGCQIYSETICPGCGQPTGYNSGVKGAKAFKTIFVAIFVIMFVFPFITTVVSFVTIGSSVNSFFDDVEISAVYGDDYTAIMDEYKFDSVDWENVLREMITAEDEVSEDEFRDLIEDNMEYDN